MNIEEGLQDTDLINQRAAIFKNLLITKFRLAEKIGSKISFSKATCSDLSANNKLVDDMMRDGPDAKVKYALKRIRNRTMQNKHLRELMIEQNRAANKFSTVSYPLFGWMRWLLTTKFFMGTFYLVVIWNMISVVLDVEYGSQGYYDDGFNISISQHGIKANLAIAQNTLGILLLLELAIKWTLDFKGYWKRFWNYVDFFVVITTTPFMGAFFGWYELNFVGETVLQACRTLVALKLIHELNALKAVFELLALTVASMVYVVVFIVMLTYLCGLIGTTLFDTHIIPLSNNSFENAGEWEPAYVFSYGLGRSILIIFKLFTLDGWYQFYKSFIEVHEVYSSSIFIFTWVFLSAFLLGNLFPALLITNFQRIRNELKEEIEHAEIVREMSMEIIHLGDQIQGNRVPLMPNISEESASTERMGVDVVLRATSYSDTSIHTVDISQTFLDKLYAHPTVPGDSTPRISSASKSEIYPAPPTIALQAPTLTDSKPLLANRNLGSLIEMLPSSKDSEKPVWHHNPKSKKAQRKQKQEPEKEAPQNPKMSNSKRLTKPLTAFNEEFTLALDYNIASEDMASFSETTDGHQKTHAEAVKRLVANTSQVLTRTLKAQIAAERATRDGKTGGKLSNAQRSKQTQNMPYTWHRSRGYSILSRLLPSTLAAKEDTRSRIPENQFPAESASSIYKSFSSDINTGLASSSDVRILTDDGMDEYYDDMPTGFTPLSQETSRTSVISKLSASKPVARRDINNNAGGSSDTDLYDDTMECGTKAGGRIFTRVSDKNNNAKKKDSNSEDNNGRARANSLSPGGSKMSSTLTSPSNTLTPKQKLKRAISPHLFAAELNQETQSSKFNASSMLTAFPEPKLSLPTESSAGTFRASSERKTSRIWGPDRRNSGASTYSTKLINVIQMFKMFSPYTAKNKGKESADGDPIDVEINVISATPRSSLRASTRSSTFERSRRAFSIEEENEKKMSAMGVFNLPGVKSKLNMIENLLGKQGKSFKVMRNTLGGQRMKAIPSELDMVKRPGVARKPSLNSLKKAFLNRKHHSEPILQRQWLMQEMRRILLEHEHKTSKWSETVRTCYPALRRLEIDTEWTDVVLLEYLHTMTELMENLMEREHLLSLVGRSLLSMTDDIRVDKSYKTFGHKPAWSLLHLVKSKVKVFDVTRRLPSTVDRDLPAEFRSSEIRSTSFHGPSITDISIGGRMTAKTWHIGAEKDDSFEQILFGPKRTSEEAFSVN